MNTAAPAHSRCRGHQKGIAALVLTTSLTAGLAAGIGCEGRSAASFLPPLPVEEPELCRERRPPPQLGVLDARVDEETAQRVLAWRRAMDDERMVEELTPEVARASLRLEQAELNNGCVNLDDVVDVGRGLFLRTFLPADGWGSAGARLTRVHKGSFGGPDALSCQSCHWKGGAAGSGDRVDNSFMFGDGDDTTTADVRNAPALWGAGWIEIAAQEITAELQTQAEGVRKLAGYQKQSVTRPLAARGISFGSVTAVPDANGEGRLDLSGVVGVDSDLVVKPFGWKGNFATLRDFVGTSLQIHMGLQAEEVVAGHRHAGLELGAGAGDDPDGDGVTREITEGELTALALYLATLDAPPFAALGEGPYREAVLFSNELEIVRSPEFTSRWIAGFSTFGRVGCASCHIPFVRVNDPRYRTRAPVSGSEVVVDLAVDGARPVPERDDEGRYLIPAFTDFKRHDMGPALAGRVNEDGVPASAWMTRRLWGLALTSPYLHTGAAMTFDEAVSAHGGEAEQAARSWSLLDEDERVSVRLFLSSLARAPSIRIR